MAAHDVEPWVVANALIGVHRALIGVHRALIGYAHRQALAGTENSRIARNLRTHGKHRWPSSSTPSGEQAGRLTVTEADDPCLRRSAEDHEHASRPGELEAAASSARPQRLEHDPPVGRHQRPPIAAPQQPQTVGRRCLFAGADLESSGGLGDGAHRGHTVTHS